MASPPPGWVAASETSAEALKVVRFVKPGEDPDEVLTFESLIHPATTPPNAYLNDLAQTLRQNCPDSTHFETFNGVENGYSAAVNLYLCPHNAVGQGEVTMIKAIRGNERLYTIARTKQVESFRAPGSLEAFDQEHIARWSSYLAAAIVCDETSDGEHPCP